MLTTTTVSVSCPKCGKGETTPLARTGDLQRFQCLSCSETFSLPAGDSKGEASSKPDDSAAFDQVPESSDGEVKGRCQKCLRVYQRLGKHFDRHVKECQGTASSGKENPEIPEKAVPSGSYVPPEADKAFNLSIEALRVRRRMLEDEILGIDSAIRTLEKLRAPGGASAPFPAGA